MEISANVRLAVFLLLVCCTRLSCGKGGDLVEDSATTGFVGREFVFGFLDILSYDDRQRSALLKRLDIGAKEGGDFFVYYSATKKNQSYYIVPYSRVSVTLDISPRDGTYQDNSAVKITSNTDISVLLTTGTTQSFPGATKTVSYVIYPVTSSRSKYFMAAAYAPVQASTYASRVMVVAVTDLTDVNVTDGEKTLVTHLNEMDVFQYDASDYRDLTGCVITSNKDVLVLSGTSLSLLPSNSSGSYPLAAQMLPSRTYRYIVPPTEPNEPMFVKVLAELPYNVTIINKTSTVTYTTKGPQMYELGTEPVSLLTSVPVTLVLYNNPFMAVVPGVDQYLGEYSFVVPSPLSSTDIKLVAIVPSDDASGLLLDGAAFTGSAKYIESVDDKYTVLTGQVTTGFHHMVNKNASVKFGLLVYCRSVSSYGFFVGMDLTPSTLTGAIKSHFDGDSE